MFEFRINHRRNAILCRLRGRFDEHEATRYAERFRQAVDQMKPGFAVISDLREYVPPAEAARQILQEAIEYSIARGRGRVIRVVAENVGSQIGNLALNRTARETGGYEAEVVRTLAEAERLLGD